MKRTCAFIIDFIIILIIHIAILLFQIFVLESMYDIYTWELDFFAGNIFLIFSVGYIIFKDLIFRNQSIGKRILGIEILMIEDDSLPSYRTIIKRNLFLVLNIYEITILIIKGRRLGEFASKTYVRVIVNDKSSSIVGEKL